MSFFISNLKTSNLGLSIVERVRYTMAECGKKWGNVGRAGATTLIFPARVGQYRTIVLI